MTPRQRRFWWAVAILLGAGAGLSFAYLVATGTDAGRSWLLTALVRRANGVFKGRGSLRIGRLRSITPDRVVAENVALVDTAGVPVVTAQRIEGALSVSGLFSKAIRIRRLAAEGVTLELQQDTTGRKWNLAYIIAGDTASKTPHAPGFGDDVRIDTLVIRGGEVRTRAPWAPHPMFTGRQRDSVIAVRDSVHDLVRTPTGLLFERRRIAIGVARAHDVVVVDVQRRPASLQLDSLSGVLSDPPVTIRHAQGQVVWTSDSLQLALTHVELPHSQGSAVGTVAWNQPGPVHYDVQVRADAGLADLGWIWDVLPTEGRGRALVRLRTLADAWNTEYTLDSLDVASGPSRVRGQIAITSRPADLLLHRVDLTFTPLHSDLLRRLSYGAVPAAVQGTLAGRLVARSGGPLTAFKIDLLDACFVDATVSTRGGAEPAISSLTLRGMVAMGARPRAWDLVAQDARLDLRSVRALAPAAPAVDGLLTGGLTVRAADLASADLSAIGLTWTDAGGNVSTVRGAVRMRYDRTPLALTADLQLDPLSMRALARIDTTLPVRASLAGRVTLDGRLDSLQWRGVLHPVLLGDSAAVGGTLALEGIAGLTASAWHGTAAGTLDAFDLAQWLGRRDVPATALTGTVRLAAQGPREPTRDTLRGPADSLARRAIEGGGEVVLHQLAAGERPAFDVVASATLGRDRLVVDSASVLLGGISATAHGALGRDTRHVDTLEVAIRADSIEAARPELRRLAAMLQPVDSALAGSLRRLVSDTLRGDASLSGYLTGSVDQLDATAALGAREVQVGAIRIGRIVGSALARDVTHRAAFEGAASLDDVRGVGAVRIQTAAFRVADASTDSGRLVLDVSTDEDAHLVVRGGYTAAGARTVVQLDSIGLTYDQAAWRAPQPLRLVTDAGSVHLDPVTLRSNQGGELAVEADIPKTGAVTGAVRLVRFPVGEVAALLAGTAPFEGTLSGTASLAGVRDAPVIGWNITGDSLGVIGYRLPPVVTTGQYADRRLVANALLRDSLGGAVRAQGQLPMDLRLATVEKRLLSDVITGEVIADSLRLQALPLQIDGVSRLRGVLTGRLGLSGTVDRPVADGTMQLDGAGASLDALGITPTDGRVIVRARADSLVLESLRLRSGGVADTLGAQGVLRFTANQPMRIQMDVAANNFAAARQRDGTELTIGGRMSVRGELQRPVVSGALVVPRANLVVNPLGARTALDLNTDAARALLGADEVPVAETAAQSLSRLGALVTVENARVDLGQEVWVQTPEARVRLTGGLGIAMSGDRLALEGEILTNRGQYRLDLGVVNRSFSIDSGRVRFYGQAAIPPTLDINATNVVRATGGSEIPVRVHIGGTYDVPVLTLSSTDPLYASAPESEIISLLVFGAPTFALDGQRQSTVQAVSGVLLPTVGGLAEGKLQQWLPKLSTLQIQTGNGQDQAQLSATRLLDNLSITAGKQIGDKTFLRVNTGVCRGTGDVTGGNRLWAGLAAEYRVGPTVFAQIGVDPGAAPCTRLGGDQLPRRQFGFDLFKEWIW
ncbi:MAG: translocation/assembly module TamB domain-containing protein [Gemmatimonadaceae bacterium]|nr:translocation/assembly module TamB domain-containing protein [Gemmatimonadaceae bacterium]